MIFLEYIVAKNSGHILNIINNALKKHTLNFKILLDNFRSILNFDFLMKPYTKKNRLNMHNEDYFKPIIVVIKILIYIVINKASTISCIERNRIFLV